MIADAFWISWDLRDSFAQATAWLPPLPPEPILNEFACRVSPPSGIRDVYVVRSALREPMMAIVGREVLEADGIMTNRWIGEVDGAME